MTSVDIPSSPLRVLVAEDDPAARDAICEMLRAAGHRVVAAVDTEEAAIEEAMRLRPDVALLDLSLAHGSGSDAARALACSAPAVAAVLITGALDYELPHDEAGGSAAVALLHKPVRRQSLDATVRLAACRARELAAARGSEQTARRQLEDRKVIERAKGILMRRTALSEQEAYRIIQRSSQDRAVPMVKIAQTVIDSEPNASSALEATRGTASPRRP